MSHLTEEELVQVVEGEAPAERREHAATCPACAAEVAAYRATAATVARFAPASRNLCPERGELVALHERALHGFARQGLEAHLAACPFCREDLDDLLAFDRASVAALVVRWAQGAVELVENALGELLPAPAPALARGGEPASSVLVARELEGARLEVLVAPARTGVAVVVTLAAGSEPLRFRVELARAGLLVEGQEAEDGRVHLDDVAPGRYELLVYRPGSRAPACEVELECRAS